jgi:16S rRNA processing protein RimM
MSEPKRDVVIGEIVSPFGIRGEVKAVPHTDFPERFDLLEEVFVAGSKSPDRMMTVEGVRHHKGLVLLKLAGINDIDGAETLRGAKLVISESDMAPLEEGEYYVHDIIGLEAVTTEGEALGPITEVIRSPAHDVYVTERAMIPAVKEFIESIDLEAGRVTVRPIPGLIQEPKNED